MGAEQRKISRLRAELARVKMERDILGKRRRTLPGATVKVRLYPAPPACLAGLGAMPGAAGQRGLPPRAPGAPRQRQRLSDEALLVPIKARHAETRSAYGWPRIWRSLVARGVGGQGPGAKANAAARHSRQRQTALQGHHRQLSTSCRFRKTCSTTS